MGARERLEALWRAAFGQPPAVRAEAAELSEALVAGLPPAPPYRPSACPWRRRRARRCAPSGPVRVSPPPHETATMTPDERTLLQRFLSDLDASRGAAKDPEADQMIGQAIGSNPDAAYLLVQHALLADQALQVARQRLDELERQQPQQQPVSFLGGAAGQAQSYPGQGYNDPAYAATPGPASPGPLSPNGGLGGFLRSAGTMAAGVAGGEFLMQGLSNLFAPREW